VVCVRVPENFLYFLSAHEDCTERLLAGAEGLLAEDLEVSPDPELAAMRKMVASVQREEHRMKAFVRLRSLGPCVLYGYLKPRHRIGAHVCDHFARRNPRVIVVLGNGRESWISLCSDGKILRDHRGGIAGTLEQLRSYWPALMKAQTPRASGGSTMTVNTALSARTRPPFAVACPGETRRRRD